EVIEGIDKLSLLGRLRLIFRIEFLAEPNRASCCRLLAGLAPRFDPEEPKEALAIQTYHEVFQQTPAIVAHQRLSGGHKALQAVQLKFVAHQYLFLAQAGLEE